MSVEYYIQTSLQHTHESQAILKLAQSMQRAFGASSEFYLLAANVHFWQAQADALVLSPHAITVIELKSCDAPVYGRARGKWHILPHDAEMRGGSQENPYQQILNTRETLIKYLDRNRRRFLAGGQARKMAHRWGHVSAALVFSPRLHTDSDIIVPPESRPWLGIIGLNEAAEFLFSRRSPHIDLRPQELRQLATEALHCHPWTDLEALLPTASIYGYLWLLDEAGNRAYAFPITGEAAIGRSRESGLVVPWRFGRTSRHHARLRIEGDGVWLQDEDSTHGTFVNGEPITEQGHPLQDGDRIALGDIDHPGTCRLCFVRELRSGPATEPTAGTLL